MWECKPVSTPVLKDITKIPVMSSAELEIYPYRKIVGELLWIACCTRPDISYAVTYLSRFCHDYRSEHVLAAKRVLHYLQGTLNQGLTYHRGGNIVFDVFVDADYASDGSTRRSVSGYVTRMGGAALTWRSK